MGLLTATDDNANMKDYKKVDSPPPGNSAIQNLINCLKIERLECGGLTIHGIMVAAYCNVILIIMGCFFLGCGVLLTAISFRPQEVGEEWGYWRTRIAESQKTRIAGPILVGVGVVMLGVGLALCFISHKVNKGLRTVHMGEVKRALNFTNDRGGDGNTPFKPLREDGEDRRYRTREDGEDRTREDRRYSEAEEGNECQVKKEGRSFSAGGERASSIKVWEEPSFVVEGRKNPVEDYYLEGSKLHVDSITGNLTPGGEHLLNMSGSGRHILVQQHSVDIASFPKKFDKSTSFKRDTNNGDEPSQNQDMNSPLVEGFHSSKFCQDSKHNYDRRSPSPKID